MDNLEKIILVRPGTSSQARLPGASPAPRLSGAVRLIAILAMFLLFSAGAHAQFITGTSNNQITIVSYTGTGGVVTVPDTINGLPVTSIGASAFFASTGLTSVTIPSSVTSIGGFAFFSCSGLKSVTIPSGVTSIGSSAFQSCTGLTSVTIPSGVTSIGISTFQSCTGLASVTIPTSVTSIGASAFQSCSGLTSVTIPTSVTNMGASAFSSCSKLTSVTIPASVASIAASAFQSCTGLTSVTISPGVTGIGDSAFESCTGLTSVTIPSSVTGIGVSAFESCTGLTTATIPTSVTSLGASAFKSCSGLTSVTISPGVKSIGDSAFESCSKLTSVSIPASVASIGSSAFQSCTGLTSVTISPGVTGIGVSAFEFCTELTSVTIPTSVTSIGASAFKSCSGLTSVTISAGVTSIGDSAFESCIKLTSVTIPTSVTSIGASAFKSCRGLTSVTISASVTSIGDSAFESCTGLTSVTIPTSVTSIGASAFSSCSGLTSVTIPSSVTSIGASAFSSCSGLTSVTIPSSVTSIGASAFDSCSKLTSVAIPSSVTSIGSSAFHACSGLTSVTIPSSVTSIGDFAFSFCGKLASVTIPTSVTSIGNSAFQSCFSLTSLTIPSSVTAIGTSVFKSCFGLTSVTIPPSLTSIGASAFYGCGGLTSVAIPPAVTSIGASAFSFCSGLTSVTIPSSVTSIGSSAFQDCSGMTSALFAGNAPSMGSSVFAGTSSGFTVYYLGTSSGFTSPTWKTYPAVNLNRGGSPIALSGSASGIVYNGATLNGKVNPNGVATSSYFQYGLTTSYGSTTTAQNSGSGSSLTALSGTIAGLSSSTTYHFQLVAASSSGTSYGLDTTFRTPNNPPPVVITGTASSTHYNGTTLSGTVNPNGVPVNSYFQYGRTVAYGTSTAVLAVGNGTTASPVSITFTGLRGATTYHYRLVAAASSGTTFGLDKTFKTLASPAPLAGTGAATGTVYNGTTLNARINPNAAPTAYYFKYGLTTSYSLTSPSQNAGSGDTLVAVTAAITGLSASTTYHYQIYTINSGGTTLGSDQTFTTPPNPPPTVVTGSATGTVYNRTTLNGTVNPNGAAATSHFQYGLTSAYGAATAVVSSGTIVVARSVAITGLSGSTTYHYRLVAASISGTTFGSDLTFTTPVNPPPAVITRAATGTVFNGTTLNGTVNPNGLASNFYFEYGLTSAYGSATAERAAGSGTSAAPCSTAISGGLSGSTTYHFRLVAASTSGTTYGLDKSFKTSANPYPVVTTGTATGTVYNGTTLNGTVNSKGVATTFYFQYGLTSTYGTATAGQAAGSGTSAAPCSTVITGGLSASTTYHYRIVATNGSRTTYGSGKTFKTLSNPPPAVVTGSASGTVYNGTTLNGTVNPNGLAATFYFQYGLTTAYGATTTTQSAGNGVSAADFSAGIAGLSGLTTYHYRLVAASTSGLTFGSDQTFTTPLNPPPAVVTGAATGTVFNGTTLNGTVNPNGLATTFYFQYGLTAAYGLTSGTQSSGSGTSASPFGSPITGLSVSTLYHYQLVATNTSGTSFGLDQTFTTADPPPIVITGTATGTTFQSAVLSGTVNPNGLATSVWFEYGTDATYGSTTAAQNAGMGTSLIARSAQISGLAAGFVYHYRMVGMSSNGTSYGNDQTFTRSLRSNADLSALQLSAGALVPGFSSAQTVYRLNVVNSVASTTVTATQSDPQASIQAKANGGLPIVLKSGKASSALAFSEGSNLVEVKVNAVDGITTGTYAITVYRETAPVTHLATGVGPATATLNATVDGQGVGVAFEYGLTTGYGALTAVPLIASGSSSVLISSNIAGLAPATLYHCRVRVTDGTRIDYGSDVTFLTLPAFPSSAVVAGGDTPAGIPNARFASLGIPAINDNESVTFQAGVSGSLLSGVSSTNNSGIWTISGITSTLLARTGALAPGGGFFAKLGDPVLNGNDKIAFLATVSGPGFSSKNNLGIWANTSGTLGLVARTHGQPLDPSGVTAASFVQIVLPDAGPSRTGGGVVFLANLVNGVGGAASSNNQGLWMEANGGLKPLLRKGDILAGGTVSALSLFASPRASEGVAGQTRNFNGNGDLSFKATFTDHKQSLFVLKSGTVVLRVAASGSAAPSILGGPAKFGVLGNPILNNNGNTAFQAFLSGTAKATANRSAILAETGSSNTLGVVALVGTSAPDINGVTGGAGNFASFSDPVFNGNDHLAFIGKLKTGGVITSANRQGIWASTSGELALVAQVQGQAPGCPAGAKFHSFAQLALPDQGGVVFLANLTGASGGVKSTNNQGIWAADAGGNLHLVARKGDALMINGTLKMVSALSVFTSSAGTAGQTRSFNRAGDLVYKVTFTDKTQAIQKVVFP